ncbi:hypothetical protein V5O48_011220 [Marasmius crinis-equi]|uniref:Uncharacterized protein n=1 Tax=Marasmius crinis-equi TaxID=585013 RepID=A0ABR3F688_9AGAR
MHVSNPPERGTIEVAKVIGALTDHEEVATRFYRSGLPIWLVRPIAKKDAFRVDQWVELDCTGLTRSLGESGIRVNLEDDTPHREVVFEGEIGSLDRYAAMAQYIRRLTTTNAFMTKPSVPAVSQASTPSSVGAIRTVKAKASSSHLAVLPKGKKKSRNVGENNRNKFLDIESPLMPASLENWARASAVVGEGFDPNTPSPENIDTGYALPDPAVIAGTTKEATHAAYFAAWLRLRPVLLYRLLSPKFRPMRTRSWHSVLGIDIHGHKENTRAAVRQEEQQTMLQECLTTGGMQCTVDLSNLDATPVEWCGQQLNPAVSPPPHVAQWILCELFEINFRYELVALDRFCYRGPLSAAEQEPEVLGVISHFNSWLIPDSVDLGKTGFASSQRNER